nr:glycine cleavage system aminomethyltransferase GcvT [Candidatus Sigynarchaeota archaeon]
MSPKNSPLHDVHVALGARFVDFGGWNLPVQYTGIVDEHENTRKHASMFDISHMGELMLSGKNAFDFLQYVCTNDVELLKPGAAQYSPLCYENGTVVDDIFYYMYTKEKYRIIVNASNKDKDVAWLRKHAGKFDDVTIEDLSPGRGRVALQGPKAQDVLQQLVAQDLNKVKRFQFLEPVIKGVPAFVGRTGYTGEDGFEISFPIGSSATVWNAIMDAGKDFHILPAGLGARDTLRLEACYSLYGNELSEEITPIEAGVEFVIKPTKKADYIGKSVLLKQLTSWIDKKIIALMGLEKGILRHGQEVYDEAGTTKIGFVTSGTFSPTFKQPIALARVDSHYKVIGNILLVKIRDKMVRTKIVNRPFYTYHPRQ